MRPTRNTLDPARLPPLLTTEQAAELLGVHVVTLCKWSATGKIAARKVVPRLWRFPREEVSKWLT